MSCHMFTTHRAVGLLAAIGLALASGCSTLSPRAAQQFEQQAGQASEIPPVTVELREDDRPPAITTLPHVEGMLVQDVLKESGALRRYKDMDIAVVRRNRNGQMVKLAAEFDYGKRRVRHEFDYAVHPGDRLIVTEDSRNLLDRTMASITEPFRVFRR